jgi:hypothetical protein
MPTSNSGLSIPEELNVKIAEIIRWRVEEKLAAERRQWFITLSAIIECYGEWDPPGFVKAIRVPDANIVGAESEIDIRHDRADSCTVYRQRPRLDYQISGDDYPS